MDYSIRHLTPADTDAYVQLRREMLEDTPFAFAASPETDIGCDPEAVRKQLGSGSDKVILGAFAPDLIGAVGILRGRHAKAAHLAHIWGMYVAPAHRRRNVGRRLLEAAIEHAGSMEGVVQIGLGVSAKTPGAQALYERVGFRTWGTEPRATQIDGEFGDEHFMSLALDD